MQLKDWLSRLERLHFKSIDMGLERIRAVADRLGLLSNTPFIFTVAGTNGKGSTVALLDAFLRNSGYRTGVYTSPHLVHFNERICIHGEECSDAELIHAFEVVESARGATSLTYFEFTTLAAIWLFKQAGLDAWVLEVGLGGRLDAVNILDADIAVVTSVDLDHQAWLGNDRATIGLEKIGIGRPGRPLVVGEPDLPPAVMEKARDTGMQLHIQGVDFRFAEGDGHWSLEAQTRGGHGHYGPLEYPSVYLQNAATAIQAIALAPFDVPETALQNALQQVQPKGRRQILAEQPRVMVDVGHNPHAARALAGFIDGLQVSRVHCVVGMLSDKDITDTLLALLPVVDRWYPVELDCERAAKADSIQSLLQEMGALCGHLSGSGFGRAAQAVRQLQQRVDKNDLILVFGSFYTVADVIQYAHTA